MPRPHWTRWAANALPYALLALSAGIIAPVFARGLPCSDDTLPHLYRAVGFDLNFRGGAPFLQWGPDFMRGYGYPIFAFYAPLIYWLVEALHLAGLSFSAAFAVVLFAALLLAAWGTYALARRWLSVRAAFVAALAYLFAPYLLYDAIQRGAVPETLALGLMPYGLLACVIAAERRTPRAIGVAGLMLAVMLLTHNVLPLLGIAVALGLGVVTHPPTSSVGASGRRLAAWASRLWPVGAAIGLALLVTVGFWLPSIAELRYTQSGVDLPPTPYLRDWPRFHSHILPISALVEWPPEPADLRLLNAPVSRTLGIGQAFLAVVGLAGLATRRAAGRLPVFAVLALATVVALLLASELSYTLWERLGALRIIQLPTRFLGVASFGAALLAGLGVETLLTLKWPAWIGRLCFGLAAVTVSVSGWPWLAPRYCPVDEPITRAGLVLSSNWSRSTAESAGEVLPRWIDMLPDQDALLDQYLAGHPVNRLRWPEGAATLLDWQTRPGFDLYRLDVAQAGEFIYQSFFFPGWVVRLDGQPIAAHPTPQHGLMSFAVPAGTHTLEIAFQRTPLRKWTLVGSAVGVWVLLALLPQRQRAYAQVPQQSSQPASSAGRPFEPFTPLMLTSVTVLVIVLYFGVRPLVDTPFAANRLRALQSNDSHIVFGDEVIFMDHQAPRTVASGQPLVATLYWSPARPLGVPYGMTLRVTDDQGRVWNQPPERPFGYGDFPGSESWPLETYVRDAYRLRLLPGTPPGAYWLETSVFRRDIELALLPAPGPWAAPDPAYARIGQLEVTERYAPVTADSAAVDLFAPTRLAPGFELLGWTLPGATLESGTTAPISLLWSSTTGPVTAANTKLTLVDAAGASAAEFVFTPGAPAYPLAAWSTPAIVRDQFRWRLPPDLGAGTYSVQLLVGTSEALSLGDVTVSAPSRSFEAPAVETPLAGQSLGFARLLGFTLHGGPAAPGTTLTLDLAWQAVAETERSYRVFVHLRDRSGGVRAQADGVPVAWTRPTTGWLAGEYLLDTYQLALPGSLEPGDYDLVAGLYDPATGERLGEALLTTLTIP